MNTVLFIGVKAKIMAEIKDEKVKGLFDGFLKLVKETFGTAQKFADVKTKDGAMLRYEGDMPMEGMDIVLVPSDGTDPIPPADGVVTLEDGTQLEIVGGKIVKVAAPEVMDAVSPTEAAAKRVIESVVKETQYSREEVDAMFEAMKKETSESFTALRSENETLTKALATATANAEQVTKKFDEFRAATEKLITEFGTTPQVAVTETPAQFNNDKKNPVNLPIDEWRAKYALK